MTDSNKSISPLRQRMIDDMTLRKLSPKTQSGYIRAVKKLSCFLGRSPATATAEDLRLFQLHLVELGKAETPMIWWVRKMGVSVIADSTNGWFGLQSGRVCSVNTLRPCCGPTAMR